MKKFLIFFILLALLPLANAINCLQTINPDYCDQIKFSNLNLSEKEQIYSSLIYSSSGFPNHKVVADYDSKIIVTTPPDNITIKNSKYVKNAWLSFFWIFPSVIETKVLFVPLETNVLSQYSYDLQIPSNWQKSQYNKYDTLCAQYFTLADNNTQVKYFLNNDLKASDRFAKININQNGILKSELTVIANVKIDNYVWKQVCCGSKCSKKCQQCQYSNTNYDTDILTTSESKEIKLYDSLPLAEVNVSSYRMNTSKGYFKAVNYSFLKIDLGNSSIQFQDKTYDLVFDKAPYDFAYLRSSNFSTTSTKNLILYNSSFFVKNAQNCSIQVQNHFYNMNKPCNYDNKEINTSKLSEINENFSLRLLFLIIVLLFVFYVIYKILLSQFKKVGILIFILILLVPVVHAESECGITNLSSCIPEKLYDFFLLLVNSPLFPLLEAIKTLLISKVSIDPFFYLWKVIIYILSFFYVFLIIYAGYSLTISGGDPIKRAHAKELLKNVILMMIFVQVSFYLYNLFLSLSSILSDSILRMIDPNFFLLTADNLSNVGLEIMFSFAYALTLFGTLLFLAIRYIVVSVGVAVFPLAIFCFYVPPTNGYGKFLLNVLGIFIFITFIDMLIILACSMIIKEEVFANFKILIMIACFLLVNYTLWLSIIFAMKNSSASSIKDDLGDAVKYISLML